jgi:hypothetical protein
VLKPRAYQFDIERDGDGLLLRVIARPLEESTA